jgi:hypothetical protein
VTEVRRVITKARATMGVATIEDLQGSIEVIVFPKVFEQTEQTWAEDAILLVAGRVDHKGEETVLLADAVWTWEDALAMGPAEFGRQLGRGDRGRRNGQRGDGSNGFHDGNGSRRFEPVAVGPGTATADDQPPARTAPLVSPLRDGAANGTIEVRFRSTGRPGAEAPIGATAADDEPPLPAEAVAVLMAAEQRPTLPVQAAPGQALHVIFSGAAQDDVVSAFGALREIFHRRPGETPVVLHIPAGGGRSERMELRTGVAYDAELVAMIGRIGPSDLRLELS